MILGEYLELSRTSLPTPPSSPENTGDGFPLTRLVTRGQGEGTYRALPHVPVQREISGYYHQTKYQDPATMASFTRSNDYPRYDNSQMERKSKTHSFYLVVYLSTEVVLDLEESLLVSKQEFQTWKNSGFNRRKSNLLLY